MMRLQTIAPEILIKLSHASSEQRRKAATAACQFAISVTNLDDRSVTEAFSLLTQKSTLSLSEKAKLDELIVRLDHRYFELQECADEDPAYSAESLKIFSQARAVSALSYAFQDDSLSAASESIYEASMCADNHEKLFSNVLNSLM